MSSSNLSFRTPAELMGKFRIRDIKGVKNPGAIAKRDVERWYSMLDACRKQVRLQPAEAVVMIYAANWWLSAMSGESLLALPQQLRRDLRMDPFYRDAQDSLGELVTEWPLGTRAAIWDAAERYDVLAHHHPDTTFGAALHQVGLHSYRLAPEELAVVETLSAVEADNLPAAYMQAVNER